MYVSKCKVVVVLVEVVIIVLICDCVRYQTLQEGALVGH